MKSISKSTIINVESFKITFINIIMVYKDQKYEKIYKNKHKMTLYNINIWQILMMS